MDFASPLLQLLPLVVILGSGHAWLRIGRRVQRQKRVLPFHRTPLAGWGLADLLMTLLVSSIVFLLLMSAAQWTGFVKAQTDPLSARDTANSLLVLSCSEIIGLSMALLLIRSRVAATARDFGWTGRRLGWDLRLGLCAFLAISVPTLLIQALLVRVFPERHPLIEILSQQPSQYFFLVAGFSAVLVAPVAEELLLRVLLQGWLEAVAQRVKDGQSWSDALLALRQPADANFRLRKPIGWPILVSATCFSALHFGQGPAPVALFLFALGLGYLYQSTHRVLPCVVVHMSLNGMTIFALWLQARV